MTTTLITLKFETVDAVKKTAPFTAGLTVVTTTGAKGGRDAVLFSGYPDHEGVVRVRLSATRKPKTWKRNPFANPKLGVRVLDLDGEVMLEKRLMITKGKLAPFTVNTTTLREKLEAPIRDGEAILGTPLQKEVAALLKEKNIASLAALRADGPRLGSKLGKEAEAQLQELQAHAELQLICRDPSFNRHLLATGYGSVEAITRVGEEEFVKSLKDLKKQEVELAGEVHYRALRVLALATNKAVESKVDRANGRKPAQGKAYVSTAAEAPPCECSCGSAVSPLAYLADLLDYAVLHVRENGNPVNMARLGERFHQPFEQLPTDCSASETFLRQVRLCVEVLRRKAAVDGIDIQNIVRDHAYRTYAALLTELGVSYSELRRARAALPERRRAVAERFGITEPQLNQFILIPPLAELDLETLFGFPTTEPGRPAPASSTLRDLRQAVLESQWQAADDLATVPLIDPDVVDRSWFTSDPNALNDAEVRYDARVTVLDAQLTAIAALVINKGRLETVLTTATDALIGGLNGMTGFGFTDIAELDGLNTQRQNGNSYSIDPGVPLDLMPHGLTKQQLDQLLITRELVVNGNAVPEDWAEAHHILVAADKKRRLYPIWKPEERTTLSVSPKYFRLPEPILRFLPPSGVTPAYLRWRFDLGARRDWLDVLSTRIEQRDALNTALSTAIDGAEEAVVTLLRDDLMDAVISDETAKVTPDMSPAQGIDLKRKWVTNELLINGFESSCRMTTRVAQAAESLQVLIWGLDAGLIEDGTFSLSAPDFDAEWRWLGTYASWRGAMWVFLYPENMLMPSLRRDQTKTFRVILSALTGVEGVPEPSGTQAESDDGSSWPTIPPDFGEQGLQGFLGQLLGDQMALSPEGVRRIYEELAALRYAAGEGEWGEFHGAATARLHDSGGSVVDVDGRVFLDKFSWGVYAEMNPAHLIDFREFDGIYPTSDGLELRTLEGPFFLRAFTGQDFDSRMEDLLYLPLQFALALGRIGEHAASLDSLSRVVDTRSGVLVPEVQAILQEFYSGAGPDEPNIKWLGDPLDPHLIARARVGTNERFIVLSLVSCLLEYAESEFAQDTSESLAKARELYLQAIELLGRSPLADHGDPCPELRIEIGDKKWRRLEGIVVEIATEIGDGRVIRVPKRVKDEIQAKIEALINGGKVPKGPELRRGIRSIITEVIGDPKPALLGDRIRKADVQRGRIVAEYAGQPGGSVGYMYASTSSNVLASPYVVTYDPGGTRLGRDLEGGRYIVTYPPSFTFCIPPNPILAMIRLRAMVGFYKLNNCINIAGLRREVPAYSAPTDTTSGVPVAATLGSVQAPAPTIAPPTQYRYRILMERAKQLQSYAQQLESTYLSYLERFDVERFTMLRAQQDLGVARSQVRLQVLRKDEAQHQYNLAELQWERAGFVLEHYEMLIASGWSGFEVTAFWLLLGGAAAESAGSIVGIVAGGIALGAPSGGAGVAPGAALGALAGAIATGGGGLVSLSSWFSTWASFERRQQEWEFQRDLAQLYDVELADRQRTLADDHKNIVDQEWQIASLSADNASDVIQFLNDKFTSAELFSWMAGLVGGVYRYLLQQSTSIAKLGQQQLAFERQDPDSGIIQDDYWASTGTSGTSDTNDRRGMTGAERLLGDITKLDQYAFLTQKRKLQLSKTISLARMDPLEFQQFRQNGVLRISTTTELFDRDFPGHYLRLVNRIRVSVIALVPPVEGIKASLTSLGISRVVRGSGAFEEATLVRQPETVALTSPMNATGMFELQEQPEMLLPFEGMGVAGTWEFRMPRASNPFDYDTIADVLVTIEYTALHSDQYRQQVLQSLDTAVQGDRVFSFRRQFADAWYDLNHPELVEPGKVMQATVTIRRADFQPNLVNGSLKIRHITLFFARKDGSAVEAKVKGLRITDATGAVHGPGNDLTTVNGMLSTREGPATVWAVFSRQDPVGAWSFTLEEAVGAPAIGVQFKNGEFTDILLVVTYVGETPPWPA